MFELLAPALSLLQKILQFDCTRIRIAYIVLYSVSTVLRRVYILAQRYSSELA